MTLNINSSLQFTTLDGDVVPVTFSHMTGKGRFAVNSTDEDFDDNPYLFNADGSHYKGLYGPLTNTDAAAVQTPVGESFTVNGTPAANLGAALILAGSIVASGEPVSVVRSTTHVTTSVVFSA